jgi:hypothetical protein
MTDDKFHLLIEHGDIRGVRSALEAAPELANRTILWHLNRDNETDPLHDVSDCVANGRLSNGTEDQIAELLLAFGAELNGAVGRESPLIGSASRGAERVSKVLIEAGADLARNFDLRIACATLGSLDGRICDGRSSDSPRSANRGEGLGIFGNTAILGRAWIWTKRFAEQNGSSGCSEATDQRRRKSANR